MSIKDKRALDASEMQPESGRGAPTSDIDRVLQLIAAQIDDADRRQAQVLSQLGERLERLESAGKSVREEDSPSSNNAGHDLAVGAKQEADVSSPNGNSNRAIPEWSADEDEAQAFVEALFEKKSLTVQTGSHASTSAHPADTLENDVWADNAADLDYGAEHDADAFDFRAESGDGANLPHGDQAHTHANELNSAISSLRNAAASHDTDQTNKSTQHGTHGRSFDDRERVNEVSPVSVTGNADDPWSDDDAERLMQVYDQDVFGAANAGQASQDHYRSDKQPVGDKFESHGHSEQLSSNIDGEWLERKFAEIAVRVEQTLEEMHANNPVSSLREHFAQFQQDMANAVGDMPTRNDIEGLKVVEGELEELREHFAHVQDQLSRLDSVEKQLESVIDRLSDDRLMTLLSGNGSGSQPDHAEFAAIVGEYVVNRVADRQPQAAQSEGKLERLEEMLTSFIEEQRIGADHQSGVLNTLQDAMVQVLDKVESHPDPVNQAYTSTSPYADVDESDEFAPLATHEEPAHFQDDAYAGEADALAELAGEPSPEPTLYSMESQGIEREPENETYAEEAYDADFEAAQINANAVDAANEVSSRHSGFEPFSDDVGSSISQPTDVDMDVPVGLMADAPETQAASADESQAHRQHQSDPEAALIAAGDSVARLRQEFINEARRAKEQADSERALNGGEDVHTEKAAGFTLFGVSLGGGAKPNTAAPPKAAPRDHDFEPAHVPSEEPKIAGMSRKKVLLGAFILMIAASGVLLLMPRGSKSVSSTPAIESVPQPKISAPAPVVAPAPAPARAEMNAPVVPTKPEGDGEPAAVPAAPTSSQPADTKFQSDGDIDIKAGDRSDVGDAWSSRMGSAIAPSHPTRTDLAGVTLQTPLKPATPEALAHISNQQSMAHWSLKLGDAASRAQTSDLLPEYQNIAAMSAQSAPVAKAALEVPRELSVEKPNRSRTQLALPPATVGPLSLRVAAAKGDPSAEFEVAARLAGGKGTEQNFKQAMKWYSRSASRGFAQSQYRLGTLYERGLGTNKDIARASIWYGRAADQVNIKAMHNLAVLSASATNGAPDYATASKWFAKAAEYGLSDSQFNLAVLHENGLGVEHDLKRAYELYALASKSGDTDSAKRRDALKRKLSAEERSVADGYIKNWRSKRGPKLANDPIYAGQAWKKRASSGYLR